MAVDQIVDGRVDLRRAGFAVDDLDALPVRTSPHRPPGARVWALRENVTPYDALYVALAGALECVLVTTDAQLGRAPGIGCRCEVLVSER